MKDMLSDQAAGMQKVMRMLQIFERLLQGKVIVKRVLAEEFHVSDKTIQRDLDDLRSYFAEFGRQDGAHMIRYDRAARGYSLTTNNKERLTADEVMVIAKILLESRAFPKDELDRLLDKLLLHCTQEDLKHIKDSMNNERFLYQPVSHNKPLFHTLWQLSLAVREKRIVEIRYLRNGDVQEVHRKVEPLGMMFSEYYFYLIAYLHRGGKEYPAVYRLDRLVDYHVTEQRFRIPDKERFQEGIFRQRVQFMQTGQLMNVIFKFWGPSIEAVADRLPNAVITKREDHYLVETEIFGRGIKMWLLSQAQYVEVLKPDHFREEMKQTIEEMAGLYRK